MNKTIRDDSDRVLTVRRRDRHGVLELDMHNTPMGTVICTDLTREQALSLADFINEAFPPGDFATQFDELKVGEQFHWVTTEGVRLDAIKLNDTEYYNYIGSVVRHRDMFREVQPDRKLIKN